MMFGGKRINFLSLYGFSNLFFSVGRTENCLNFAFNRF